MQQQVIRGIDDEIEFKGFKGRYFYILAGITIGLLVVTFLLYAVGFNSIFLLFFSLTAAVGAYLYIKNLMDKNGKHGHIHASHNPPTYIIQNEPFYKLIRK
jgi:hypothetical protein